MEISKSLLVFLIVAIHGIFLSNAFAQERPGDGEYVLKCFGCHGRNGITGYWEFPNLAGQNKNYLISQLKSFRDGHRVDLTMEAMPFMVEGMSDEDLNGLAGIFSSMKPEKVHMKDMTPAELKAFELGKEIINSKKVTCRFCHLANKKGDAPLNNDFPVLTGQQKGYLINQINAFRDRIRGTPVMNSDLVGNLSDIEVDAIATYLRYFKAE